MTETTIHLVCRTPVAAEAKLRSRNSPGSHRSKPPAARANTGSDSAAPETAHPTTRSTSSPSWTLELHDPHPAPKRPFR
jgi:hypothetical protein